MKLKIVTPDGVIFENHEVESVSFPTEEGIMTVKEDHVPLITLLQPGEVVIVRNDHSEGGLVEDYLAISKGLIQINPESDVKVLADTAERAEEIDLERAEEARKKAEVYRKQKEDAIDVDYAMIQAKLDKELARIEVGKKYKKIRM